MIIVRLLSPGPWLVQRHQVYSGLGSRHCHGINSNSSVVRSHKPGPQSNQAWAQDPTTLIHTRTNPASNLGQDCAPSNSWAKTKMYEGAIVPQRGLVT